MIIMVMIICEVVCQTMVLCSEDCGQEIDFVVRDWFSCLFVCQEHGLFVCLNMVLFVRDCFCVLKTAVNALFDLFLKATFTNMCVTHVS